MSVAESTDILEMSWQKFFEHLLKQFSTGLYEKEILSAKGTFFEKLGRSHEMKEDVYESVSQSFLEWYIFDYKIHEVGKTPAVIFLALEMGSEEDRVRLRRALFHHLSVFKVVSVDKDFIRLQDLLFNRQRLLEYQSKGEVFQLLKVKPDQIIQARLFQSELEETRSFATHIWLHPKGEWEFVEKLCQHQAASWGLHKDFLRDSFQALVRSLSLEAQMAAARTSNWLYRELGKKYGLSA